MILNVLTIQILMLAPVKNKVQNSHSELCIITPMPRTFRFAPKPFENPVQADEVEFPESLERAPAPTADFAQL